MGNHGPYSGGLCGDAVFFKITGNYSFSDRVKKGIHNERNISRRWLFLGYAEVP